MHPIIDEIKQRYNKALQDPTKIEELQKFFVKEVKPFVVYFKDIQLDVLRDNKDLEMELITIINATQLIYTVGGMDTGIDDTTYDILWELAGTLEDMQGEISITQPVVTTKQKGYHLYPSLRGTLDKIYYLADASKKKDHRKSLEDWVKTCERKLQSSGESINLWEEYIYVFPKWDGVSVVMEYDADGNLQRALTRGYTQLNEAILVTPIFKELGKTRKNITVRMNPYPDKVPFGTKYEIMTSEGDLTKYNLEHPKKPYKNTRAFASGIMNGEVTDDLSEVIPYLRPIALRTDYEHGDDIWQALDSEAFQYPHIYCKLKEIDKIEEFAQDHHYVNGLRCDGAVIYLTNPKVQKILGREHEKQKFEVAYKFTEEYGYSNVTGITWSVGMYGNITPVVEFDPIKLKGNKVKRVSLGSIGKLKELDLGVGDIIKIGYDIIPVAEFDSNDEACKHSMLPRFQIPQKCALCEGPLTITEVTATCENPKCPARIMGRIKSHIERMNIAYIGDSLIEQMYQSGIVMKIEDLYKLEKKKSDLLALDNFGKKKFERLAASVFEVKNTTIDEAQLFGSLSIKYVSVTTFRKIFSRLTVEELLDAVDNEDYGPLKSISGIGETTARWIVEGLKDKDVRKTLEYLQKHLKVERFTNTAPKFELVFSSFGKEDPRKEKVKEIVKELDGAIRDTISSSTNFLVVPDKSINSRKVLYAKNHRIPIYTAEEFVQRIKPRP